MWKWDNTLEIDEGKLDLYLSSVDPQVMQYVKRAFTYNKAKELLDKRDFKELFDTFKTTEFIHIWLGNNVADNAQADELAREVMRVAASILIKQDINFLPYLKTIQRTLFKGLYFVKTLKIPKNIVDILAYSFETYSDKLDVYLPKDAGVFQYIFGSNPKNITVHAEDSYHVNALKEVFRDKPGVTVVKK